MIRFFIACGLQIVAPCNAAEAADAAVQLTQGERSAGYEVFMLDEDGSETEIVGEFDLIKSEARWA